MVLFFSSQYFFGEVALILPYPSNISVDSEISSVTSLSLAFFCHVFLETHQSIFIFAERWEC